MVEDVEEKGGQIMIRKAASLWQHVRLTGEDIIEGDMLFPVNYRLGILDIGLLLAAGIRELRQDKAKAPYHPDRERAGRYLLGGCKRAPAPQADRLQLLYAHGAGRGDGLPGDKDGDC